MWRRSFRYTALPPLSSSLLHSPLLPPPNTKPYITTKFLNPIMLLIKNSIFTPPSISSLSKPFSSQPISDDASTALGNNNNGDNSEEDDCDDDLGAQKPIKKVEDKLLQIVETVMVALHDFGTDGSEAKRRLHQCCMPISPELVAEVLSRLRNDWGAAFTFFLWAGNHPGYAHSAREYHSMISILGKMRRFDTAWPLVNEMKSQALVTPHTLMILIRKYCAIHDVGKAINVFYAFKKFGFTARIDDFQGLLSALCRYKNVEDAEHLLFCNESTFPFETKSFNIVLNGWCNVMVYLREAKRFWRDMGKRGIPKDVVSYGSMISCKSKAGNLNDVLKFFNEMKEVDIAPDQKVYNAVIYALAKGGCIEEAKGLVKAMEEKGVVPNAVTFNSLIRPLCKAQRVDDARVVFDEMLQRGLTPSVRTYHAFFDVFKTVEEVFDLLNSMKERRCFPVSETYIMLIRKLCRWRQHESVFRLWNEMRKNGMSPDRSAYIVYIHGLFMNGRLDDAFKFYEEMKAKGFAPEPKTEAMIQAWLSGKEISGQSGVKELQSDGVSVDPTSRKPRGALNTASPRRDSLKQPKTRSVTRERGFSLW